MFVRVAETLPKSHQMKMTADLWGLFNPPAEMANIRLVTMKMTPKQLSVGNIVEGIFWKYTRFNRANF